MVPTAARVTLHASRRLLGLRSRRFSFSLLVSPGRGGSQTRCRSLSLTLWHGEVGALVL